MSAESTLLRLTGIGVPPYAARGLKQTLYPIGQAAQLRRTVNGSLKDLSLAGFRKYGSEISGEDVAPPAFDGAWPGMELTVDCIHELCFETNSAGAQRTVVPGSAKVEGDFTFYRPRLVMRVTDFSGNADEWGAIYQWTMTLEEV